VTEAMLAHVTLMRNDVLAELRRLGVGIAIDNFGSEYSSFDYLRTYSVSYLKITQSMIEAAVHDPIHAATIRAILSLARELGVGVIAEGVETAEQHGRSSATSAVGQGFYFSAPMNVEAANQLLRRGSIDVRIPGSAVGALGAEPAVNVAAEASATAPPSLAESARTDQPPPDATHAPSADEVRARATR
jgi:predicted signal transduction protein with EAL and GGDEF domain